MITPVELELSAFRVRGEPVPYAEAVLGEFVPFHVGDAWGSAWSTTWFRVRGRVPREWADRRVGALIDLGFAGPTGFTCEALAWKGDRPCAVEEVSACPRSAPQQLTPTELAAVKELVTSEEYRGRI